MSAGAALTSFDLTGLTLRNRVVFPGHTTNFGIDSLPTPRHLAYLSRRARGGAAAVITEAIRVHPTSAGRDSTLGSYHPQAVPAYAALVEAVHAEGAAAFAQIMHAGRQAAGDSARTAAWGPSATPWSFGAPVPHAMSVPEIQVVIEAFGTAAAVMEAAGFDGVEVHLGHGHLLQQFLSPAVNQRSDAYGGSLDGRLRLAREVLQSVVSRVRPGFRVGVRISAHEFLPGGLEPEAMLDIVDRLRTEFPLAFLHVSHSAYVGARSLSTQMADMSYDAAPFRAFPRLFRQAFPGLPVIAVCRVDDIGVANDLIDSGDADLVAMARAQIAEPDLVVKAQRADPSVRSCLACNQACIGRIELNLPLSCVVNPSAGEEERHHRWGLGARAVGGQRSVLVVGAGPAGLEAAVTARRVGARVVVLERSEQVGGQVQQARRLAGRERLGLLVDDLEREARSLGVDIRTGVALPGRDGGLPADVSVWADYDHIVVATGSVPMVRELPGPGEVVTAETVMDRLDRLTGRTIAVVDDEGSWIGGGVVEALARAGARVYVVSAGGALFSRVTVYSRLGLLARLAERGVSTAVMRRPVRSSPAGLVVADVLSAREETLPGVNLVVDLPARRADDAAAELVTAAGLADRLLVIGDALAPRSLTEAVYEARDQMLAALNRPLASLLPMLLPSEPPEPPEQGVSR